MELENKLSVRQGWLLLVAKSYSWRKGFDYNETYAPVTVCWVIRKQATVSLSSTEAEYQSLASAVQ